MKFIIAFAFLIAGISAIPQPEQEEVAIDDRRVTGIVYRIIDNAQDTIRDAGLDPLHIKGDSSSFALPVPELFNYEVFVEDILSTGLSHIQTNRVTYNVITSLLKVDVELPFVYLSLRAASAEGTILGAKGDFKASGKVEISRIRVEARIRVNVGLISGISIRNVSANFSLGGIRPDVKLAIQGQDLSKEANDFIGSTIPNRIRAYNNDINKLLEIVIRDVINANL